MTDLTPSQIAAAWLGQNGNPGAVAIAVAVALAESGGPGCNAGNPDATGGDGEIGLWQILPSNLVNLGIPPASAYTPSVNAYAAIQLSQNGTNWGDWCTAWANPTQDCATGSLSTPQPGSAAQQCLAAIGNQVLGGEPVSPPSPPAPPPPSNPPGGGGDIGSVWSSVASYQNYGTADIAAFFQSLTQFTLGGF